MKLDPHTLDAWVHALRRLPSAVLWLLAFPADAAAHVTAEAAARGVPPHRLRFSALAPRGAHLEVGPGAALPTPLSADHTSRTRH